MVWFFRFGVRGLSLLEKQRREAVEAASPGLPLMGGALGLVAGVLDALGVKGGVEQRAPRMFSVVPIEKPLTCHGQRAEI